MHWLRRVPFLLATFWGAAFPGTTLLGTERAALRKALDSIHTRDIRAHVDVLAADSFEGREAGSRGGRAAAGYLSDQLKQMGLPGGAEGESYYQPFSGRYRNVIAVLEGSHPELAKEYVILGAHYDHVGYGSRTNSYGPTGYIHNGADDNASGTTALLEIAEALTQLPVAPQRSVMFIFFDGEEKGLLGSKHWTASPTIEREQIVAMINMDMVGRLRRDKVEVYGTRTASGLRQLISRQNRMKNLRLDFTWEMKGNSDHYSFYRRSIPTLMFHTGLHDNYHRPSDDAHLINVEGIQDVARLVFLTTVELAEDKKWKFRDAARRESPADKTNLEQAYTDLPPRLGISWQTSDPKTSGLLIRTVSSGSAAFKTGLRAGDRIVTLNGRPIATDAQFRRDVLAAPSVSTFTIERESEAEAFQVTVRLPGKPVRVGFSWKIDQGEPGTALVARIIPGSAADAGGLRLKDRIYEVNGQKFADSPQLLQLVKELPGPLEFLVERYGRLRTVTIDVR